MSPLEQEARLQIDALLEAAGWQVQDAKAAHIHAARWVAIREFSLPGHGFADYLLYVNGKAAGVIEAKKVGSTLTGVETRFTNGLDPDPCSRGVFDSHRFESLVSCRDNSFFRCRKTTLFA